jgi:hypothetical protein
LALFFTGAAVSRMNAHSMVKLQGGTARTLAMLLIPVGFAVSLAGGLAD